MNNKTTTPNAATITTKYRTLDTYSVDCLNDSPPRREEITEIQAAETGELLCYAVPDKAELIVRAVSSFEALREALRKALPQVKRFRVTDPNGETVGNDVIGMVEKALALADGKEVG